MSSRTVDLRLGTLAICVAVLLPRLAHRGMFLDGVTYASIARNLAEGRGRFWAPHYTATIYPAFHEHPPLAFWLQSQWFRLLGDHWFVERAYSAAAAALIAILMAVIWRAVHRRVEARDQDWLPILLWMAAPVVSWTIVGNLLEPTVAVFVTAAVAILVVQKSDSIARAVGNGTLSGLCVTGAALSKGPVGLFPLAAPLILLMKKDRPRAVGACTAAQWITVVLCGALLLAAPESRNSLGRYLDDQVVSALAGRREVSAGSLTIVTQLVLGVWLPMGVIAALLLVAARRWIPPSPRERSIGATFMLLAFCGTLPLLISPKQAGHYLMPAVPFYAIAVGAFIAPTVTDLAGRLDRRSMFAIRLMAGMVTVGAVLAAAVPAFEREPVRLAALDRLAAVAPQGATAGICPETNSDWGLHAWFQRRFRMSLDAANPASHEWFLQTAGDRACAPPTCRAATDTAAELVLLRCDR